MSNFENLSPPESRPLIDFTVEGTEPGASDPSQAVIRTRAAMHVLSPQPTAPDVMAEQLRGRLLRPEHDLFPFADLVEYDIRDTLDETPRSDGERHVDYDEEDNR